MDPAALVKIRAPVSSGSPIGQHEVPAVAEKSFRTGILTALPCFFATFSPSGLKDFRGRAHGDKATLLALFPDDGLEIDDVSARCRCIAPLELGITFYGGVRPKGRKKIGMAYATEVGRSVRTSLTVALWEKLETRKLPAMHSSSSQTASRLPLFVVTTVFLAADGEHDEHAYLDAESSFLRNLDTARK